jgi:hypothetical protein
MPTTNAIATGVMVATRAVTRPSRRTSCPNDRGTTPGPIAPPCSPKGASLPARPRSDTIVGAAAYRASAPHWPLARALYGKGLAT